MTSTGPLGPEAGLAAGRTAAGAGDLSAAGALDDGDAGAGLTASDCVLCEAGAGLGSDAGGAGCAAGTLCGCGAAVSAGAGTTAGSTVFSAGSGDGFGSSMNTIVTVTANTRHRCYGPCLRRQDPAARFRAYHPR